MCGNTLSVGWRGEVYDCDFNQQLGMQWKSGRPPLPLGPGSRRHQGPRHRPRQAMALDALPDTALPKAAHWLDRTLPPLASSPATTKVL
jgi:Protein of unknown function (DUF3641)